MKKMLYVAVCLFGFVTRAALAVESDTSPKLCINNAEGIRVTRPDAKDPEERVIPGKDGNYQVWLKPTEALDIRMCEHNPVLFTYKAEELVVTALPDVEAIKQFAAAVEGLGKIFSAKATAADVSGGDDDAALTPCSKFQVDSIAGLRLEEVEKAITKLSTFYELIPTYIEETHRPTAVPEARKAQVSKELADAQKLKPLLPALSAFSLKRMAQQPIQIQFKLDGVEHATMYQQATTQIGDASCEVDAQIQREFGNLEFIALNQVTLTGMLEMAERFGAAFQQVGSNPTVATVRFNAKNHQSQPVTLANNEAFSKLFNKSTRDFVADKAKTGKVTINVDPKLALRVAIAPGAIYSFVKQPKYSAVASNGAFKIAREQSDYAAVSGIVALNITRGEYMSENLRPFLQIGISPKKDEFAFLLGAGFALTDTDNTILSFGAIYQERQRLIEGLAVGSTIATASELKLDNEFEAGFYLGLSYNLGASK